MLVSAAATRPPVSDSATATVWPRAVSDDSDGHLREAAAPSHIACASHCTARRSRIALAV